MNKLLQLTVMLIGATLIVAMIQIAETLPQTQKAIHTILTK